MIETTRVEMESEDIDVLRQAFPELKGALVRFSNGCVIVLNEEAGCYWGDDPYGSMFAIDVRDGWEEQLLEKIAFWNEPRDETGRLLHPEQAANDD